MATVGIISDTHGLLRPEAVQALQGVDIILHAGDIGSDGVLQDLQALAPVTAVRGNVDTGDWAKHLPQTAVIDIEGVRFFVIHRIDDLGRYPVPPGTHLVIYGHSHKPLQCERDGIWYLNPGSAGRRRFSLPISLVMGQVDDGKWCFSIHELTSTA